MTLPAVLRLSFLPRHLLVQAPVRQMTVQVTEQPSKPGELPMILYSFDEHEDMRPYLEPMSDDESETSAALSTGKCILSRCRFSAN